MSCHRHKLATESLSKVVWTLGARQDVQQIWNYVSQFAPLAAQRLVLRLVTTGDSLSEYPIRGRSIGGGIRELTIVAPYLIQYRVENGVVDILTVRHGARE